MKVTKSGIQEVIETFRAAGHSHVSLPIPVVEQLLVLVDETAERVLPLPRRPELKSVKGAHK